MGNKQFDAWMLVLYQQIGDLEREKAVNQSIVTVKKWCREQGIEDTEIVRRLRKLKKNWVLPLP